MYRECTYFPANRQQFLDWLHTIVRQVMSLELSKVRACCKVHRIYKGMQYQKMQCSLDLQSMLTDISCQERYYQSNNSELTKTKNWNAIG
jgi:hypothetical protein